MDGTPEAERFFCWDILPLSLASSGQAQVLSRSRQYRTGTGTGTGTGYRYISSVALRYNVNGCAGARGSWGVFLLPPRRVGEALV